jgi:hypothetical protein
MMSLRKAIHFDWPNRNDKVLNKLFVFILVLLCLSWTSTPQAAAQNLLEPIISESGETGLTLTWTPPAYSLTTVEVNGVKYSQLHIPGASPSVEPGSPELPLYSGLIGLPPTGEARLRLVEVAREIVAGLPRPAAATPRPAGRRADHLSPASQSRQRADGSHSLHPA